MTKPNIFYKDLDNDLTLVSKDLSNIVDQILSASIFGITKEDIDSLPEFANSVSSYFGKRYNLFDTNVAGIDKVKSAVLEMTTEALNFYNLSLSIKDYSITSWFNLHGKSGKQPMHSHFAGDKDNMVFHGYYCVNAEPSITHYLINDNVNNPMDIVNKNNRAILLENGHPHGIGDWPFDEQRITIAYDVIPTKLRSQDRLWTSL